MFCNFNRQDQIYKIFDRTILKIPKYESFEVFVKDLYKNNVFKNNLDFEAEVLITAAQFYQLMALSNDNFKSDVHQRVLDVFDENEDNLEEFIKHTRKIFGIKYQAPSSRLDSAYDNIEAKVNTNGNVFEKDIKEYLDALSDYMLHVEVDADNRDAQLEEIFRSHKDKMLAILSNSKYDHVTSMIESFKRPVIEETGTVEKTNYVDTREVLKETGVTIAFLKDGSITIGIKTKKGLEIHNEKGEYVSTISNVQIKKFVAVSDINETHEIPQHVISNALGTVGLELIPLQQMSEEAKTELSVFLSNPEMIKSNITVTAHRNLNTDGIVNFLKASGKFTNHTAITLENTTQADFLKMAKSQVYATSLPRAGELFYTVTLKSGDSFMIKTLENISSVNHENGSERFLPTDPKVDLGVTLSAINTIGFKKEVLVTKFDKSSEKVYVPFTTKDSVELSHAIKNLRAFNERVYSRGRLVTNMAADQYDITADFLEFFNLAATNIVEKVNFDSYFANNSKARFTFDVVKFNDPSNPQKRELPIVFKKIPNSKNEYAVLSPIGRDERIFYKGKSYMFDNFVENILKIDYSKFSTDFTAIVLESSESTLTPENIQNVDFSIRYVNRINTSESVYLMGTYFNNLMNYRKEAISEADIKDRNRAMMEASKFFQLKFYSGTKKNPVENKPLGKLFVNISLSVNDDFQLEFRAYDPNTKGSNPDDFFARYIEALEKATDEERQLANIKNKATFIFPKLLTDKIEELYSVNNSYIKALPKEAMLGVDMKDPEQVFKRLQDLKNKNRHMDILGEYFLKLESLTYDYGNFVEKSFQKLLENIVESQPASRKQRVEDTIKAEFPTTLGIATNYVDLVDGRQHIPIIYPKEQFRSEYYESLSNYYILENSIKSLDLLDTYRVTTKAVEAKTPKEPAVPETIRTVKFGKSKKDNDTMLSIDAVSTDQETITAQINYIKALLPQFDIREEDLKDILENMSEDVSAFGAFKDKVIYLDKNLKGSGVVYHEAFHGVFRHLLSSEERSKLINSVKSQKKNQKFFTEEYKREFSQKRKIVNDKVLEDLIAEEILADEFQGYTTSRRKSIFSKLFDLIMKLLNLFNKHQRYINKTFARVNNGFFTQKQIESNLYEGQTAFKLISGTISVNSNNVQDVIDNNFTAEPIVFTAATQKELVHSVAALMMNDSEFRFNPSRSFDESFELIRHKLVDFYDINNLIAQNPSKAKEIMKRFGKKYYNFHFVLSAGTDQQNRTAYVGNLDPSNDLEKDVIDNPPYIPTEVTGIESLNELKGLVLNLIKTFAINKLDKEVDDTLDELAEEGIQLKAEDEEDLNDELKEEVEDNLPDQFESTLFGINVLTSVSAAFKEFFSTIIHYKYHEDLGIEVPMIIDGSWAFNAFLKMASDVESSEILPTIRRKIEKLKYDEYDTQYEVISVIFNNFLNVANVDPNTLKHRGGKGLKFYNEFIDTFYKTSTNSVAVRQNRSKNQTNYRTIDQIIESDARSKYRMMLSEFVTNVKDISTDKDLLSEAYLGIDTESPDLYKRVLVYYKQDIIKIVNSHSKSSTGEGYILSPYVTEEEAEALLERMTTTVYNALGYIGMRFPKSMIRFSLLAIDHFENKSSLEAYKNTTGYQDFMDNYVHGIKGNYMTKGLFKEMVKLIYDPLIANKSVDRIYSVLSNSKKNSSFDLGLRKALTYLVDDDVFELQSMTLDAEKKPRYRYSAYTPFKLSSNTIKRKGLQKYLKSFEYADEYMNAWFNDHPFMQILNGPDSLEKDMLQLMMSNLDVSTNMGIDFYEGALNTRGKTFKNLDRQSQYIIEIIHFLNQSSIFTTKNGEILNQPIYKRSLGQLEGSRTNFLINSPVSRFVDLSSATKASDSVLTKSPVKAIAPIVLQEFNRIRREARLRKDRLDRQLAGDKNLIIDFNAKYDGTNIHIEPRPTNSSEQNPLRAYEFGYFGKMMGSEYLTTDEVEELTIPTYRKNFLKKAVTLREYLRDKALKDEDLNNSDIRLIEDLISEHLDNEFKKYLLKLNEVGIIEMSRSKTVKGVTTQVNFTEADSLGLFIANIKPTDLLPNSIRVGASNTKTTIEKVYGERHGVAKMLMDKFLNDYVNSTLYTQLFDGDFNMSVKDLTEWIKRAKQYLASGQSGKHGFYNASVVPEIKAYVSDTYASLGQFRTMEELVEAVEEAIADGRISDSRENVIQTFNQEAIFDGQAITSMMHQIMSFEQIGRLDEHAKDLMIKASYSKLKASEIDYLKSIKAILNSKKTVHAGTATYLKHSEHLIIRSDVSVIDYRGEDPITVEDRLRDIYNEIFAIKTQMNESFELLKATDENVNNIMKDASLTDAERRITELAAEAHSYFIPKKGREILHELLNEMELQNVDYLSDTNASKRTTMLPEFSDNPLLPGSLNKTSLEMIYKFHQVETSRIKEKVKSSVQHKMLLGANKEFVKDYIKYNLDEEEQTKALNTIDEIFKDYEKTLRDSTEARLKIFEKIILDDKGEFKIEKLYELIRASLIDRNADSNLIKLFELKNGKPVFSSYIPQVSEMLKHYYFSAFSKNVTEESTSGGKYFHVSSYGREVIYINQEVHFVNEDEGIDAVLEQGQIISSDFFERNREQLEPFVSTRSLKVDIEVDEEGTKTYWVEAVVPKPNFKSQAEADFWMRNISKMFGTRIPTEDKRSMIAFKIVDFVDAAYMNTIMMPHVVHMLAGSDFDIDTLYVQSFNYFVDNDGNPFKYGDAVTDEEKYKEYLYFIKSQPYVKDILVSKEFMMDINDITFSEEFEQAIQIFLGESASLITENVVEEFKQRREELKTKWADRDVMVRQYVKYKENTTYLDIYDEEQVMFEHPDFEPRVKLGKELAKSKRQLQKEQDRLDELEVAIRKAIYVANLVNTLSSLGLPSSFESFSEQDGYQYVVPALQNLNLNAKLNIIANEHVYNSIYIKERAESDLYKNLMKMLNKGIKEIASEYDIHTTTAHVESKAASSSAAQGIGIAANMNKFMALASLFNLKLSKNNIIWELEIDNEVVTFDTYGGYKKNGATPDEWVRAIAVIGETLGMFTDALKKPIPAVIGLNDYNSTAALAMLGLNMPPEFVVALLQIKELKESLPINPQDNFFLTAGIQDKLSQILEDAELSEELFTKGIIKNDSVIKTGRLKLDKNNYTIRFNAVESIDDPENAKLSQMGIRVLDKNNEPLSEMAQRVVLLELFRSQLQQQFEIYNVGKMMDYFKKLKSDFKRVDKTLAVIDRLKNNESLFENSSVIFKENSIWSIFERIATMISDKADVLYVSKNPVLKGFFEAMSSYSENPAETSNKLLIHLALERLKATYFNSEEDKTDPESVALRKSVLKMFNSPYYWYDLAEAGGRSMSEDLDELNRLFPENAFLKYLVMRSDYSKRPSLNRITTEKSNVEIKDELNIALKYPEFTSKIKLNNLEQGQVISDAFEEMYYSLRGDSREILERLLMNEIIRTGLQPKSNTYLSKINPELGLMKISDSINEVIGFMDTLKNGDKPMIEVVKSFSEFFLNEVSETGINELIDNMINIAAIINVESNPRLPQSKSMNFRAQLINKGYVTQKEGQTATAAIRSVMSTLFGENSSEYLGFVSKDYVNFLKPTKITARKKKQSELEKGLANNQEFKINLDLKNYDNINQEGLIQIARSLGIGVIETEKGFNGFKFPMYLRSSEERIQNPDMSISYATTKYYKLKSLDDQSVQEVLLTSLLKNTTADLFSGTTAIYEEINLNQSLPEFSPVGKTIKFLDDIKRLSSSKNKISVSEEQLERDTEGSICKIKTIF